MGGEENRGLSPVAGGQEIREVVRAVMQEMGFAERETLEKKVNELIAENQRAREAAEAAERSAAIRAELQRLGVTKIDLAYRAVKDDVYRGEDGRLMAQGGSELRDYLAQFVDENPELLPARLAGGSGARAAQKGPEANGVDLSRIRPGMSAEELDRVRQEVARVAAQTLRGA
ncbi:MAG TPA: hypothetical protein VKX39_15170 [Bryobacteraceae bacterium]|jgi:hypothetical protein|nr:hypothetical protein [Bryobacteraceae bacterium]